MPDLSYLQAISIGALQGVTELFPVSSLGHSILVPAWIGGSWESLVTQQEQTGHTPFLAFIVALHVATALALLLFYWHEWLDVLRGLVDIARDRSLSSSRSRFAALLVMGTIPAGLAGLALDKPLRTAFATPVIAAFFLTLNGVILAVTELLTRSAQQRQTARHTKRLSRMPFTDALLIGAAQILALLPGISRSGVTICAGLLRNYTHERATRFALMLATPLILAAGLLKMPELATPETAAIRGQVLVGMAVAFVAAYLATRFLTRLMKTRTLWPFVVYCLIAGIASLVRFA